MSSLRITNSISIPAEEIHISPIRAQGAGGQNVNKVSSAVHLRFTIIDSSLPQQVKERLLALRDRRISSDGCLIIKGQQFRSFEKNKEDALNRLAEIIRTATHVPKVRKATRPSKAARAKRLESKAKRAKVKSLRKKVF